MQMSDRTTRPTPLRRAGQMSAIILLAGCLQGCLVGSYGAYDEDDPFTRATESTFASASYARRSSNITTGNARQARTLVSSMPVCDEASSDIATAREIAASTEALAQQADADADAAETANTANGQVQTMSSTIEREVASVVPEFERLRGELNFLPHDYLTGVGSTEKSSRTIGNIMADYDRISEQMVGLGGRLLGLSDRLGDFLRGPQSAAMRAAMPDVDFYAMEREIAARAEALAVRANLLTSFLVFDGDESVTYAELNSRQRRAISMLNREISDTAAAGVDLAAVLFDIHGSGITNHIVEPGFVADFMEQAAEESRQEAADAYLRTVETANRSGDSVESLQDIVSSITETCGRTDVFADVLPPPDWMSTDWLISSP